MNKPECLGLLTLETSMIVMYEFGIIRWNQKTEKNQKYVTGIKIFFIVYIKTEDIYWYIARDYYLEEKV